MVYQFTLKGELTGEYDSYRLAAEAVNKPNSKTRIREACVHNYKSHGYYWSKNKYAFTKEQESDLVTFPKIFVLDIETSFMLVEVFSLWTKFIPIEAITRDWHLLTWAGVYIHDGVMLSDKLTPEEAKAGDDLRIVNSLWEHLHNADIVVAHNGNRFDLPKFNTRMMAHDLPPYSPVRSIDTLKQVKKLANHTSSKLDYLAKFYNVGGKIHTDRELWHNCTMGNKKQRKDALLEMETYNKMDVDILLDTYLRIRPYMRSHPNLGVYINDNKERCHYCGSDNLQITNDSYTTNVSKFQLYRCCDCGGFTPTRFTTLGIAKRKSLLKSLPL